MSAVVKCVLWIVRQDGTHDIIAQCRHRKEAKQIIHDLLTIDLTEWFADLKQRKLAGNRCQINYYSSKTKGNYWGLREYSSDYKKIIWEVYYTPTSTDVPLFVESFVEWFNNHLTAESIFHFKTIELFWRRILNKPDGYYMDRIVLDERQQQGSGL